MFVSLLFDLLGGTQPVILPNLYVNEHNSLGSSGNIWFDLVWLGL